MSSSQCIEYNADQVIAFGNSAVNQTLVVLPIRYDPYVHVRYSAHISFGPQFSLYFLKKYASTRPTKDFEICGPLPKMLMEFAKYSGSQ